MANRLTTFSRFPWTGGLNTSVDASLLDPNELTQADNIIFTTQGTRRKREGIDFNWDDLAVASVSRASAGTVRTLVTSGYIWQTGERFTLTGMPAAYNAAAGVVLSTDSTNKSVVIFTVATPGKVNWTAHGLANGTAVAFRTTGTLPAGGVVDKVYFVANATANDFEVVIEPGGTSLPFADAGTGIHTAREFLEDIITYTGTGSLTEGTTADVTAMMTLGESVIGMHDFWYDDGATKNHRLMSLTSAGRLFSINTSTGVPTLVYETGTPYTALPLTTVSMVTFDNRLMIAVDGQNNVMKYLFPVEVGGAGVLADVVNTPTFTATPRPTILQVHLGRLWCDDKDGFDRIHYSETGAYNVWQGAGDSGALDVTPGDGDPYGISAIFPPFKGDLIVTKRSKMYRVIGPSPELFQLAAITDGLGCVGQQSVAAVDQDDIMYVSDRGIHSLNATDAYGAFTGAYLSSKIQGSINSDWNPSAQDQIKASYVPTLNSVAFTVAEGGSLIPRSLWFYNVPLKSWYRWPNVVCTALVKVQDPDRQRLYIGTDIGRVGQAFAGATFDTTGAGVETAVTMQIKTGRIFPDGSPSTLKAFKQLGIIYKPTGTYNISASVKIDNFSTQPFVFSDTSGDNLLGVTFVLGQSVLGAEGVAQAFIQTLDGYGKGFSLSISQSGINEFGEILGFQVYYEGAEWPQESRKGDTE